jgi:hypothetical protein
MAQDGGDSRHETMKTGLPPRFVHDLKNHLGTIVGFTELVMASLPNDDPRVADLVEVRRAANDALELCRKAGPGQAPPE